MAQIVATLGNENMQNVYTVYVICYVLQFETILGQLEFALRKALLQEQLRAVCSLYKHQ